MGRAWLLILGVSSQLACLVGPTGYRLDFSSQTGARCGSVSLPVGWTFDEDSRDEGDSQRAQVLYEARRDEKSESFLLAGRLERGSAFQFSDEIYEISFQLVPRATLVDRRRWEAASASPFVRNPVRTKGAASHEPIEPRIDFAGKSFSLTGKIFWNAPEVTRLSESGRYLLGISYTHSQGALRPKSLAHFDLFSTRTGRRVWSAIGEGPSLPPLSQFEAVAWIGDNVLFMPHNGAGTRFDVCHFVPEALDR